MATDGERVIGGGNEDQGAFPARAWFLPAESGKHGRFYIGFEGVVESGMNDQGLFYDSLAAPESTAAPKAGRPVHHGMWTLRALETCSSVDDVAELVGGLSIPGTWSDQLFFADRNGDSVIVEGTTLIRSAGRFQICTNFLQSSTPRDEISCSRYRAVERLLGAMESLSPEAVRDVFAATAASWPGGSGTSYTTVYEPRRLVVTCYFWRDYEHPIVFDLGKELEKGARVVELADLSQPNPRRDDWVAAATRELERSIEARIDRSVDQGDGATDLVGHYAVAPEVGVVPAPPAMIHGVSVVRNGGSLVLVPVPEGIYFDLHPAGGDVWFHTNVTMKPKMDFALRKDDAGRVVGATLKLVGLGEIPLVKVSGTPRFAPLPTRRTRPRSKR